MSTNDGLFLVAFVAWPLSGGLWFKGSSKWKRTAIALGDLCGLSFLSIVALELPAALVLLIIASLSGAAFTAGLLAAHGRVQWRHFGPGLHLTLGLVLSWGWLDGKMTPVSRQEDIETSVVIQASPIQTWSSVKNFGALSSKRTALMALGLSHPGVVLWMQRESAHDESATSTVGSSNSGWWSGSLPSVWGW